MARLNKTIIEILMDARKDFIKIPGVLSVGFGLKLNGQQITEPWALRVYVMHKKPIDFLKTSEMIPKKYKGLTTDVLPSLGKTHFTSTSSGGTRPLLGGLQIARNNARLGIFARIPGIGTNDPDGTIKGTLGYILGNNTDTEKYILSCEHILQSRLAGTSTSKPVYQPSKATCADNLVGHVTNGHFGKVSYPTGHSGAADYFVDCAVAKVKNGIETQSGINKFGPIPGFRDLIQEKLMGTDPCPGGAISVKKLGIKTGLTKGVIHDCAFTDPFDPNTVNQILIFPKNDDGQKRFTGVVTNVTPANISILTSLKSSLEQLYQGLNFISFSIEDRNDPNLGSVKSLVYESRRFGERGDSGAVIVEDKANGKLLGLIHRKASIQMSATGASGGESDSGGMIACHLGPVLQQLDLVVKPSNNPASASPVHIIPQEPVYSVILERELEKLRKEITQESSGSKLIEEFITYGREIAYLVHHNRPTKVIWYRNKGPQWGVSMAKAIDNKTKWVKVIHEVPLPSFLEKMYQVILENGSSSLGETLRKYYPGIRKIILECDNFDKAILLIRKEIFSVLEKA